MLRGELHQLVDHPGGFLLVVDAGQQVAHVVDDHHVGLIGLNAGYQIIHTLLVSASPDIEHKEILVEACLTGQLKYPIREDRLGGLPTLFGVVPHHF